ncbi:hypothetical protein [Streptomyces spectabilis]|uniref:Secreted protein n=1 Tax=Streptomyces spectabilis TaxID=68270 RepID=A0A5P2XIR0_STRST|nr:hypothetical protein [Streptomyces spectabilis]MBB5109254.1 hypothetical protein [Streptomyces spectabilis]MCI3906008.1 hypothetical protein [Streptomyces spectabilis]QEV62910.1 hypothetical protein CP982_32865 [Streptomyces spectabilis]GGV05374.1 hypothetical protein GCM10010245_11270 [Streptomyces spectabilis]
MTEDVRLLALGAGAAVAGAALALYVRGLLSRRRLRRKRAFFGLPEHAESLFVVNREAGGPELTVTRHDVLSLLELAAFVKDCGAHTQVVAHDAAQQGFGERTEFCLGNPAFHRRMAAHMHSLLPGVRVNADPEPGPDRGAFQIGAERYRMEAGIAEYVLLARLTAGQDARPVFLFCGQRATTNQAATRYLARHHERLARKQGDSFVLLLKVVNSQAYGPDVVELVGDVTRAAQEPIPAQSARGSHRAK